MSSLYSFCLYHIVLSNGLHKSIVSFFSLNVFPLGSFNALLRELVAEFTLTDNSANTTTSLLRSLCHYDDSVLLGSWLQETDHKSIEDQVATLISSLNVCRYCHTVTERFCGAKNKGEHWLWKLLFLFLASFLNPEGCASAGVEY